MKKIIIIFVLVLIAVLLLCFVKFADLKRENSPDNAVNIVFTTDISYKEYLKVAIKSAIVNKNPESLYNIIILCVDLNQKNMDEFKKFECKNVKINMIPLKIDEIKNVGNFEVKNYVSRADLFKFFMPYILNQYNKVLYIDSDTIILGDLTELYNTDIKNYYLGAVIKYVPIYSWHKLLGLFWYNDERYEYNCGVMLLNLKKMRRDNITKKLIIAKNKDENRVLMTQEAFNTVIPTKKIKKLSPIYNAYTRWKPRFFETYEYKKIYSPHLEDINSMQELFDKSVILHYAGHKKPWFKEKTQFSDIWWKYAKMVNPKWEPIPTPENFKEKTVLF